jgi:TonB family protein
MRQYFWVMALMAINAWGAEIPTPSRMYIVSAAFSDFGALFYYRVVDVRTDGPDVVIRYSRIGWTNPGFCPRKIVQGAQVRLSNRTIKDLVKANNPCAVNPRDLAATVKKFSIMAGHFETFSAGVVATCGSTTSVLELPDESRVDLKKLKSANAKMGRLWNLMPDVVDPTFGQDDIFQGRTEAEDLVLQRAGQEIVPELASGRYDEGLAAAVHGNDTTWRHPRLRDLLNDYRGPITNSEAKAAALSIVLVDADQYRFSAFAKPDYPALAAMARIQGEVTMRLSIDPATGDVTSAEASSGNKILQENAVAAAKKWRLEPSSAGAETISVTLRYSLQCR